MKKHLFIISFTLQLLFISKTVLSQEQADLSVDDAVIEIESTSADSSVMQVDTLPGLESEPQLKGFIKADYPADLQKSGVAGIVRLVLLVSETGVVDSVGVVKGCHPVLDKNAADAAKKFVFTPAKSEGKPIAVLLEYDYEFSLTEALVENDTSVNFSGNVLEKGTRAPVADATISVTFEDTLSDTTLPVPFSTYLKTICGYSGQSCEAGKIITTTDSLGKFSFKALPCCSVLVTCISPGYEMFWQREVIVAASNLSVVYWPERSSYSEYEIVVYGKVEEKEVSQRQLSKKEVKSIPGVGGDAVRVVQALPGVGRPTMGSGDIVVRGSRPWDSGYFLDGLRIPQLYHLDELKSVYNTEAIETVNFLPGGTGVRHGGYTGGIIEIVPRKARTDKLHGFAELNGMDVNFSLDGPINKNISFLIAARRSFLGDALSKVFEKLEDWGQNLPLWILLYYWDYVARTDIRINDHNNISLSVFGSRDSMLFISNQSRGGSSEIESSSDRINTMRLFTMITAGWQWDYSSNVKNNLQYGMTINREHLSAFGSISTNQKDISHQIRDELTFKVGDHLTVYPGVDLLFDPVDFTMALPDASGMIRKDTLDNWLFGVLGAYLFAEYKATDHLTLLPGIRFDYFPELDYHGSILPQFGPYGKNAPEWRGSGEPSVRLGARYAINERHTAKAALGTYSQTPQPMGQVIHPTWGNPKLPTTKASQYVVGYEWKCTDLLSVDLQAYTNYQWDIPRLDTSKAAVASGKTWSTDMRGRMFGLELMLRYLDNNQFFGWVAYTLSRSERKAPEDLNWALFDRDIPNYLQLVGGVHLPFNWDASLRLQYSTGIPQTPVIGRTLYENSQQFVPRYGKPNSERMDPYFTLGVRFDHVHVTKRFTWSGFIDLPDLLGPLYMSPEFYEDNYDYTERQPVTMIPIIMGGFRVQF
jgi:TonB family protein